MAQPPPPTGDPPSVSQVAAGSTVATGAPASGLALGGVAGATGAAAAYAGAAVAGAAGAAAIAKGVKAILSAMRAFLRRRGAADIEWFTTTVTEAQARGQLADDDVTRLRRQEKQYEVAFQRKALARWQKRLPGLLAMANPEERALALRIFQDREKRLMEMRAQAMAERAQGAIERTLLKQVSPQGAYWKLNPHVKQHTLDCIVMGEKFWPWSVLEKYHPPRHFGCPCTLYGLQEALARGLMTTADIPNPVEALRRATVLMARFEEADASHLEALADRLEEGGVTSADLAGVTWPDSQEAVSFAGPRGEAVEAGHRVAWEDGDRLAEGVISRIVEHHDEQLGRYWTFCARDGERTATHVLASSVTDVLDLGLQEADWSEHLHPRDRLGRWRDAATLNAPKVGDVAARMAHTSLAWMQHAGQDLSDAPSDAEVEANWARQLRGRVSSDKEARRLVDEAIAENEAIPIWRTIVASHLPDHVVVSRGERKDGRFTLIDTVHGAHRVAGTTVIPDANVALVAEEGTKRPPERAEALSGYGLAALLRHEYGHSIDDTLKHRSPRTRRAIIDAIGDASELSYYAEYNLNRGNDGEVIPELLGLVTHPDYREEDFPERVREAGRLLLDAATGGLLQEARYSARLHPRDRLGKWIETLGFPAYRVGGAVRDPMLGKSPNDVDYMLMADPQAIKLAVQANGGRAEDLMVRDRLVGVRAHVPGLTPPDGVEIAPPRVEVSTGAGRHDFTIEPHPLVVGRTPTPEEAAQAMRDDAVRRDFTVNAMYQNEVTGEVIDPLGGQADMGERQLRTTSPQSFAEDPLRTLRGLRFMSQHGLALHPDTEQQMIEHAGSITALTQGGVSGTAITELNKLLMGEHVGVALRKARDTGVLASFLPELAPAIGFDQQSKYHNDLLDEHIIQVVENTAKVGAPLEVRLAALFHDSGKPEAAFMGTDGRLHYYGGDGKPEHAVAGARIAREALGRLNYPADTINRVTRIITHHMLSAAPTTKLARVRQWRREVGPDIIDAVLMHRRADVSTKGGEGSAEHLAQLERFAGLVASQADAPTSRADLAITGADLVAGGMKGPEIGKTLDMLVGHVVSDPSLNRRDWLLKQAGVTDAAAKPSALAVFDDALRRADSITRADVEAGRVPGVRLGGLAAGVAGNAGQAERTITIAPSGFDADGSLNSVLLAHEVGHYLTNKVLKDGVVPPELAAFEVGRGRAEGRYGKVAGSGSLLFGPNRQLPEEFIADSYADLIHGRGEFSYVPGFDGPDDPQSREDARREFEASATTRWLRLLAKIAKDEGLPGEGLWKFEPRGDGTYRLAARERLQEAPDFDLLHPRNRLGRFRLVPRTSEEVLALRTRAYEKRWGPVPPGGLAKAPTPVDDPELLDALEAAHAKNVEHLGPDVIDHFGEKPVVLVEDLGTGFWGAVANADGLYSAHALRKRFVLNGVEQPSFLDGKPKPHRGDMSTGVMGTGGAHDLASVIRHEWWHYVENQLSYDQMREYRSLFPRVESGGIDGERIAREVGSNAGADQGETAAEVFSLVSDPDFKPSEWPDWVYESGQAMLNLIYELQEGLR